MTEQPQGTGNDAVAWRITEDFTQEERALMARFGFIKFAPTWTMQHYEVQVAITTAILNKYGYEYFLDTLTGQTDPADLRTRVILQVLGNYNVSGSADLSERIAPQFVGSLTIGNKYSAIDAQRLKIVEGVLVSHDSIRAVINIGRDRLVSCNIYSLW